MRRLRLLRACWKPLVALHQWSDFDEIALVVRYCCCWVKIQLSGHKVTAIVSFTSWTSLIRGSACILTTKINCCNSSAWGCCDLTREILWTDLPVPGGESQIIGAIKRLPSPLRVVLIFDRAHLNHWLFKKLATTAECFLILLWKNLLSCEVTLWKPITKFNLFCVLV